MDFLEEINRDISDDVVNVPFEVKGIQQTHKLTFLSGRAKNFRSIGNKFIDIDYTKDRSTLVISDENGAGKSTTTVWLIYYAITGQPYYKKEKLGSLVNSSTRKDMLVELEFLSRGTQYKIVRGRKPDIFELWSIEEGQWKQYKSDAAGFDLQSHIWTVLGLEEKSGARILENACILGRERYQPFLTMSAEDRRLMVESVWDLAIFRHMMETAKKERAQCKEQMTEADKDLGISQSNLSNAKERLDGAKMDVAGAKQLSQQFTLNSKADANKIQDEIDALKVQLAKLEQDSGQAANEERQRYQTEIDELKVELDGLSSKFETKIQCDLEQVNKRRGEIDENVSTKQVALETARGSLSAVEVELNKADELYKSANARMSETQLEFDGIEQNLKKARQYQPKIEFEFSNSKQRLHKFETMGECPQCEQTVSPAKLDAIRAEMGPAIEKSQAEHEKLISVISGLEGKYNAIRLSLTEVQAEVTAYRNKVQQLSSEKSDFERSVGRLESDIALLQSDVKHLKTESEIRDSFKPQEESQREQIKSRIQLLEAKVEQCQDNSDALVNAKRKEIDNKSVYLDTFNQQVKAESGRNAERVKEMEGRVVAFEQQVKDEELTCSKSEERYNALDKDLKEYEFIIDMLGEKEGKADVIRLYLPFLNAKINEYLEGMNMFINLELDEQFNPSMLTPDRKGQTLFSLSTGQRARVDLAIIFALRDVANLKASFQTNLLILDEVLENLSQVGVTEAVAMIKNKFQSSNLFVITQRAEEFSEHFENRVCYSLKDGQTTLV